MVEANCLTETNPITNVQLSNQSKYQQWLKVTIPQDKSDACASDFEVETSAKKSAACFNGDIPLPAKQIFATLASPLQAPQRSLAYPILTTRIWKTKLDITMEWPHPNSITENSVRVGVSPTLTNFQSNQRWSSKSELAVDEATFRLKRSLAP